jgi:hypothetical protein
MGMPHLKSRDGFPNGDIVLAACAAIKFDRNTVESPRLQGVAGHSRQPFVETVCTGMK